MKGLRNSLVAGLVLLSAATNIYAAPKIIRIIEIRQTNPDGDIQATTCETGPMAPTCHIIIKVISEDQHKPEYIIADIDSMTSMVDIKFRTKGDIPLGDDSSLLIDVDESGRAKETAMLSRQNPLTLQNPQLLVLRSPGDTVAELEITVLPSQ